MLGVSLQHKGKNNSGYWQSRSFPGEPIQKPQAPWMTVILEAAEEPASNWSHSQMLKAVQPLESVAPAGVVPAEAARAEARHLSSLARLDGEVAHKAIVIPRLPAKQPISRT